MKQSWVLDASALLAAIQNEPSGDFVKQNIEQSVISSINWSEVLQKIAQTDMNAAHIETMLLGLGLTVIDFTAEDACLAAFLWPEGKKLGLSLADRACLATAKRLKVPVVTADKAWKKIDCGLKVILIR